MRIEYYEITIEWSPGQDIISKIYNGDESDLLKPWYSALSNVYGKKNNSYDGYIHKVLKQRDNCIKLICYLLDNHNEKIGDLNLMEWESSQLNRLEEAIKNHIYRLPIQNVNINPTIVVSSITELY